MITGNMDTRAVLINGFELTPTASLRLRNHSPDGFAWGYGGSGPSQLALALLIQYAPRVHKKNIEYALTHYQDFKFDIVAGLKDNFELDEQVIKDWIEAHP